MKKINFILATLITLLFSYSNQIEAQAKAFNNLDNYLQTEIKAGRLKGVHAAVYQNGSLVFDHFYGFRDVESKDTMQGNEEYFIQSMTKPIVTVGLMKLYEAGKIKLDDPIEKYLPEFKNLLVVNDPKIGTASGTHPANASITIKQLLSHTSGLSHGISPIAYDKEIFKTAFDLTIKTLAERVTKIATLPLMFQPGTKFTYSFSVDLTARIIEVVSGKSLDVYLKENILDPLGMKNTGYNLNELQTKREMMVYDFKLDKTLTRAVGQPKPNNNSLFAGVNGLFSTTHDYMVFAEMLLNKGSLNGVRILKPATVDLMTTTVTDDLLTKTKEKSGYINAATGLVVDAIGSMNLEPGYDFGLGLCVLKDPAIAKRDNAAKGEFFWSGANATHFFVNPTQKLVAVFMTQIGFMPNRNPYGFYFGDEFRKNIYKDLKN
ncbi:MAG: serine hydrolase domain-containing protein [Bacteroidota bacterium]